MIEITVYGTPAPQGSKRAFAVRGKGGVPTGRVAVIESSHDRVKSWRQAVIDAALSSGQPAQTGPLAASVTFYMARPRSHYGTGRNAAMVKASAPVAPHGKPDLSKLLRATEDALTDAGLWLDDAQVVMYDALSKQWADGRPPGAVITIRSADRPEHVRQAPLEHRQVHPAAVPPVVRPLAVLEAVAQRPGARTPPPVGTRPAAYGAHVHAVDGGEVIGRQELQRAHGHDLNGKRSSGERNEGQRNGDA